MPSPIEGGIVPTPTVQLLGAGKSYRGTTALAGIDLNLYQGVVGLLGPNGAGKTTLLRMLATVLGADQGSVRILGRDPAVGSQRTDIRRRLGYLPQELGYPRGFTAYGFLDYMAVLKEWDEPGPRRAEVRRVLEQVDLGDRGTKRIRALSGGQRRRVGLAQALLGTPELLVLDEPTNGLDPEQRVSLRHVLAEAGPRRSSWPRTRRRTSPPCANASSCSTVAPCSSTAPYRTW
jgi:ABC-2 type transport system ATP-binding protein